MHCTFVISAGRCGASALVCSAIETFCRAWVADSVTYVYGMCIVVCGEMATWGMAAHPACSGVLWCHIPEGQRCVELLLAAVPLPACLGCWMAGPLASRVSGYDMVHSMTWCTANGACYFK
jgi:hypothetical protein